MIYLKTQDNTTNLTRERLFWCWGDVHTALFSPDVEPLAVLEFKTRGKTYAERRENLRALAHRFIYNYGGDLIYSQVESVRGFFLKNGKQYGLVKEFKQCGLI